MSILEEYGAFSLPWYTQDICSVRMKSSESSVQHLREYKKQTNTEIKELQRWGLDS